MRYRSKFEARCAAQLGPQFAYETVQLPYTIAHHYLPDFVDSVGKVIVEAKGRFSATDRAKMLAVKAQNPQWRIIFWFQDSNLKINKKSKTTYHAWAIRHGFEVL